MDGIIYDYYYYTLLPGTSHPNDTKRTEAQPQAEPTDPSQWASFTSHTEKTCPDHSTTLKVAHARLTRLCAPGALPAFGLHGLGVRADRKIKGNRLRPTELEPRSVCLKKILDNRFLV